jgi:hypothetical protein
MLRTPLLWDQIATAASGVQQEVGSTGDSLLESPLKCILYLAQGFQGGTVCCKVAKHIPQASIVIVVD